MAILKAGVSAPQYHQQSKTWFIVADALQMLRGIESARFNDETLRALRVVALRGAGIIRRRKRVCAFMAAALARKSRHRATCQHLVVCA
jgi:hypothetical protein